MQKLLTFFQQKYLHIYVIFNDQSFYDTLINHIISFEQMGPNISVKERALSGAMHSVLKIKKK